MTAKVTWGHGVQNAVVMGEPSYTPGRLLMTEGGGGTSDDRPGYDGYSSDVTAMDRTYGAFIKWLTGKSSGANILVLTDGPPTSVGHVFGIDFQAGLTRMGHTYTLRGSSGFTDGGAYDPLDYDMVCSSSYAENPSTYHGANTREDVWAYLLEHGGNVLSVAGSGAYAPWGFGADSTNHWTNPGHSLPAPAYYVRFDASEEFGGADDYKYVFSSNVMGTYEIPYGGGAAYEPAGANKYVALNNTHGGHAWIKCCNAQTPHTDLYTDELVEYPAVSFWTLT